MRAAAKRRGDAWNRYESQWYSSTLLRIAKEKRRNAQKSQGGVARRKVWNGKGIAENRIAAEEHGLDKQSIKQSIKIGGI